MTTPTFRMTTGLFIWSYLIVLGLAFFFSKALSTVPSHYLWPLTLTVVGLAICGIFLLVFRSKSVESPGEGTLIYLIFQLIQGVLLFVLGYLLFHLPLKGALVYPMGALVALMVWWLLTLGYMGSLSSILMAGFLGAGLVIALRLQGVFGGLAYGLALLNGFWLGAKFLKRDEGSCELWLRGMFFMALLVVGRAAIQYYLLKSNYANLGVVITHPYTYAALFAGIFLPMILWIIQKGKLIPLVPLLILLGIILPFFFGIFIHVRPMAGYLLGLVTSSFIFGLLFLETYWMGVICYLNLAVVTVSLPLFAKYANLSRWIRLEILGGIFILGILGFFILQLQKTNQESERSIEP